MRVWAGARSTTTVDTFDQLKLENYVGGSAGTDSLPPTSSGIRGHIQRRALLVFRANHLLDSEGTKENYAIQKTLGHGWEEYAGTQLPCNDVSI